MSSMTLKSDLRKLRAKTAILAVTTIALGCSSLAFAQNEDKVKAGTGTMERQRLLRLPWCLREWGKGT